jgi:protocatechuate 3,4-dioxygenase beta subunit
MRFSARCLPAVLFSLLSFAVPLCAQSPAKQTSNTPRGTVSGRVTIKDKAAPGVAIGLRKIDVPGPFQPYLKATIDQDGYYRISNVSPGTYEVAPSAPAFVIADNNNSKTKNVVVGEDENVEGINFSLVRGGVITGKVTDAEGRPVIQQQVSLFRADSSDQASADRPVFPVGNAQTDDRGIYRMYGLSSGRYRVGTGRGDAFMGQNPFARSNYRQVFHPDVTDQAKATVVEVSEGSEAGNIDIKLGGTMQTFSLSGRVIDGEKGLPVPDIRFGLQRAAGIRMEFVSSLVVSNAQGDFFAEGLIPGKYAIFLLPNSNMELRVESLTFDIIDQDVSGLTVKLIKGAILAGAVVLESEDKTAFQTLQQMQLRAFVTIPNGGGGGFAQSSTSPISPDGSFRLPGLPAGVANIILGSAMGPMNTKGFLISRIERDGIVQPRGIEIKEGEQISGLRIVVSYGTGKVRGVVKLENGALPPGAQLFVRLAKPGEGPSSFGYRPPQVDARGHFLIEGIAPGVYELSVMLGGGTPAQSRRVKQEVSVQDGVITDVVITLELGTVPQP